MLKSKSVVGPSMLQMEEVMEEIKTKEIEYPKPRKAVKKKRTKSTTKKNTLQMEKLYHSQLLLK